MQRIKIKPLSANLMYKGKKYRTQACKNFYQILPKKLDKNFELPALPLKLKMRVGCGLKFDVDNVLKPFIDILQVFYGFNDRNIFKIEIEKKVVKPGEEFIEWQLESYRKGAKKSK